MAELGLMKESAEKLIKQYHTKAPFVPPPHLNFF